MKKITTFLISTIGFTLVIFSITEIVSNISTDGSHEFVAGNLVNTLCLLVIGVILNIIVYYALNTKVKKLIYKKN